ncbi:dipeptidyl peptidase 1 [Parasteatoda tepidariorum]|uniref:dipeptidyl peptidase 1 n=1 Tax=Parasteatoda tepidariorum TaxID=114398 RepID=UPI001C729A51|nr:dipeptidyl peptidase 1 [Parasteatoda tepidariorum]
MTSNTFCLVFSLIFIFSYVNCDTPANCTYEDIRGKWIFLEGKRESNSSIDCSANGTFEVEHTLHINLLFPNVAVDSFGNKGFWTIVYNQGFEVVINYRKYFAFSSYKSLPNGTATSLCDRTLPGWSHDVLGKNWACYKGYKLQKLDHTTEHQERNNFQQFPRLFDESMVQDINKAQKSWTAVKYPELHEMSLTEIIKKAGGLRSRINRVPPTTRVHHNLKKLSSLLPDEFDWRNVNGINYVSPIRNQGSCGSCYAFSSLAMLESRLRIMTNNSLQVQFSPQDIVSCSVYSQGCEGGFPYAIAGKYAQDFGVLPEECFPYEGQDSGCNEKKCKRYYVADYKYVGGFFGGCNEELMRLEIVKNGPLTVAFQVYPDFMLYQGGIYHHTGVGAKFNPFHEVNHGVLITGYGVDEKTGEKFWIVKNSWGTGWGEQGYFRIRRSTNECNIESMAVSAIPIP